MTAFIDANRDRLPVAAICRVLEVSESAYYRRRSGKRSVRAVSDARVLDRIRVLRTDETTFAEAYGYRRTWLALRRQGETVGRRQVQRLMGAHGLRGLGRRRTSKVTTMPDPHTAMPRPADLVDRNFTVDRPGRLWVSDFTYCSTWEGRGYLSFVLDAYSRRIVGWQYATNMGAGLVIDALRMALATRPAPERLTLVAHSDAGSQYTSGDYRAELADAKVAQSIGSVGDAYDCEDGGARCSV